MIDRVLCSAKLPHLYRGKNRWCSLFHQSHSQQSRNLGQRCCEFVPYRQSARVGNMMMAISSILLARASSHEYFRTIIVTSCNVHRDLMTVKLTLRIFSRFTRAAKKGPFLTHLYAFGRLVTSRHLLFLIFHFSSAASRSKDPGDAS